MTEIEKIAKILAGIDVNDPIQLIQLVALQGAVMGLFKARENQPPATGEWVPREDYETHFE